MARKNNFIPSSDSESLKPLYLPDCIYLSQYCRCGILCVTKCMGEQCPFRRIGSEYAKLQEERKRRLNSLSVETQKKIAANYYGGLMPWKEKNERG